MRPPVRPSLLAPILALLAACQPAVFPEPDLVPEKQSATPGPIGWCAGDAQGLTVRVRNQTNNPVTVQTVTAISFSPGGTVTRLTPPIGGGASAVAGPFPIPHGCFDPDCEFTITVDAGNEVDESHADGPDNHETNNSVAGGCVG